MAGEPIGEVERLELDAVLFLPASVKLALHANWLGDALWGTN
jgi:hypothetical protein